MGQDGKWAAIHFVRNPGDPMRERGGGRRVVTRGVNDGGVVVFLRRMSTQVATVSPASFSSLSFLPLSSSRFVEA